MRQLFTLAAKKGGAAALAAVALAAVTLSLAPPAGGRAAANPAADGGPLVVAITDGGMTPQQATIPAGLVHLRVENRRAEAGALTVRVARGDGSLVRDIILPQNVREAATELELSAGSYTLTETAHPSWSCQITVQISTAE